MAMRQAQLLAQEQLQNDRLRELDVIRREFVSILTHEFRTPLTSIIGYTEVLELGQDEPDADSIRGYAEIIRRNGDRLLRLVNDLLTLDRLESRLLPVVASEVNVADVVSMAVRTFRAVARGKGISLQSKVRDGPTLSGDAERLGQLVDNLIANALKFTEPGGRVRVTAKPVEEGWSITVSDTGIGIPSDEIDDLFERFYRASNAKQLSVSGSGLGLAIVRAIVDQHHGSISVQSEEAFVTTFQVLLRDLIPTGR